MDKFMDKFMEHQEIVNQIYDFAYSVDYNTRMLNYVLLQYIKIVKNKLIILEDVNRYRSQNTKISFELFFDEALIDFQKRIITLLARSFKNLNK